MNPEDFKINREPEAQNAFTQLADQCWLDFTDDATVPEGLGEVPELFFRMGFLIGLQTVAMRPNQPEVQNAMGIALELAA